ncbi:MULTISPECIES: (2Fe-2S)-binding protein [unclassified Aureimonas]|uniref:(2Fe-2S)-binding protein n=1 Tax=unclassified Aureimonas TaxID=2615206 RepID=UPI0006F3A77F|nr:MULTISPECIES: (2Fe-2S)-binding protein [unclassified Aureimonas]KQT52506.1 (2Fe-2S)-binding protein [Aureimonas sp. Leaf427]KQT77593.1 (2Fe-2S)-binding protein [Aureimonas sp. Leaf460]
MPIRLTVNGRERSSDAPAMGALVDLLRDEFHLTGAKPVCREGFCGACMVLIDGVPTLSCLTPAALVEGSHVRTIEGLCADGVPSPLQAALERHDAVQCGMCFPGMVVTLTDFLERTERPSREAVRAALTGNICRCTGYERIVDAALSLASDRVGPAVAPGVEAT